MEKPKIERPDSVTMFLRRLQEAKKEQRSHTIYSEDVAGLVTYITLLELAVSAALPDPLDF